MNRSLFYAAGLLMLASCSQSSKPHYVVTVNAEDGLNDKTAYIMDFDTEEKIDSAVITNGVAVFDGEVETPRLVVLSIDNQGYGNFYLEADSITVTEGIAKGGDLNAKKDAYWKERMATIEEFRSLPDSAQEARYEEFQTRINSAEDKLREENMDNALGYYYFLYGPSRELDLAGIDSVIAAHPSLGDYKRVQQMRQALINKEETSEGKMFKDFEVTYNDSTFRLSDYVGKGKYVLVDFWASWCGPCIRQTKVIKELYAKYKDKGLDVVGVAVWDEPDNTLKAIKSHALDWPCIINAQNVPTDLYGISGIPCIILINPEGIIVSRDKQSQALIDDVDKAMSTYEPQALALPAASAEKDTASADKSGVIF